MRKYAGAHDLEIPPVSWLRAAGALTTRVGTRWGQAVTTQKENGAIHVQTGEYLFAPGTHRVKVTIETAPTEGNFGVVQLVDVSRQDVLVSAPLVAGTATASGEFTVRFDLGGDRVRRLAIRVASTGATPLALTNIAVPVNYGFEVIDLTQTLNTFNTHASSFDAHPNERAHQVIADAVYAAMGGFERTPE
jgi:hypothetical protein